MPEIATNAPNRLTFKRTQRLHSRSDFDQVREKGQAYYGRFFKVIIGCQSQLKQTRLGIITGRKYGNAVARTKIRRQIREIFRTHQHEFAQIADIVIIPKRTAHKIKQQILKEELTKLWTQAKLLKN